jgi:predicted nucleic acid-binding protein
MKNTALLIDTNIVLDWLLERKPFVTYAEQIIRHCINGKAKGYLACHSILNIFYITRKVFDIESQKEIGLMLCGMFQIIGIDSETIFKTLKTNNLKDLEDGLQMQCAYYEVLIKLKVENGKTAYVITSWIVEYNNGKTKLTSVYVKRWRKKHDKSI